MVLNQILLLVALLDAAKPQERYFKSDHYTGAAHLRLAADGSYDVTGREHMGIWVLDKGTWVANGTELRFTSGNPKTSPFRAREVTFRDHTFLVLRGKGAPSIEVPEGDILADLKKPGGTLPPYVFFEIGLKVYACETEQTYRFKFYPEVNAPNVCGERE